VQLSSVYRRCIGTLERFTYRFTVFVTPFILCVLWNDANFHWCKDLPSVKGDARRMTKHNFVAWNYLYKYNHETVCILQFTMSAVWVVEVDCLNLIMPHAHTLRVLFHACIRRPRMQFLDIGDRRNSLPLIRHLYLIKPVSLVCIGSLFFGFPFFTWNTVIQSNDKFSLWNVMFPSPLTQLC